jgi:hypothetical protein
MLMVFGLVEYCATMLEEMDVASDGLRRLMVGSGEWPEVDVVRMRVFIEG